MADQSMIISARPPELKPGDEVKIVAGPFAGGRARVQAVENGRVRVEMKVLGQPAPFTVGSDQVRPAD